LEVRWDLGYNGQWNIPFSTDKTLSIDALNQPGLFRTVAEVRDGGGLTDRTLVMIKVLDEPYVAPPEPSPEPADIVGADDLNQYELAGTDAGPDAAGPELSPEPKTRSGGCNTAGRTGCLPALMLMLGLLLMMRCRKPRDYSSR